MPKTRTSPSPTARTSTWWAELSATSKARNADDARSPRVETRTTRTPSTSTSNAPPPGCSR
ncbi:MAG: hypothetical protein KF850_06505 [Labilithrix sp.]|nr:hypothetical protein [Labilithrix sp.]